MSTTFSMRRPQNGTIRLLALAVVAAVGSAWLLYQRPVDATVQHDAQAPAPMPVSVSTVIERSVTEWDEFSGRLEAIDGVEVRSRVAGYIESVNFEPGSIVKKGDVLFVIDPRPFAAEVARAEAAVASAAARLSLTTSELARAQRLLDERAIAQREFDERRNAHREAQAALQGAQAALEMARLQLGYTRVRAPIGGRVSRAEVTVGNLVAAGAGGPRLTSIVSTSPIYASFEVDERSFLEYAADARHGTPNSKTLPIFLGLANESGHPHRGALEFIDNRIDPHSGTILLRAVFDNADGRLTPGMYARLKVGSATPTRAVLVDDRAIGTDQNKRFVLVVGPHDALAWREVRLGPMIDGLRVVREGLQAGERIVVNGLHRVRPGMVVAPRDVPMNGSAPPIDAGIAAAPVAALAPTAVAALGARAAARSVVL